MIDLYNFLIKTSPVKTGQITANVYAVKTGIVNLFLYRSAEDTVVIDSGFGKGSIKSGLDSLSINPESVTHLFLTHSDFDHAGGLSLFAKAGIYLASGEEPLITGEKARMSGFYHNSKLKRAYNILNDGDIVTAGSIKIRAIATPGHTPGSMSYLVDESVLFVGDTFKLAAGKVYPLRLFNMDTKRQQESIRKLARLDHVLLACTAHSGYTTEFSRAISYWK